MLAHLVTIIVILCITLIRAATIAQIAADNEVLTKLVDTVDAAVVKITVQSGKQAAQVWLPCNSPCILIPCTVPSSLQGADEPYQQIPHDLYSLTKALATTGYNDTCNDTETTSDPALEDNVTQSYGLFTNTVEELMFDLSNKESTLACYNQRDVTYKQILYFNSTFVVS